jgi:PAS domain S-box-containing protein
VSFDAWLHRHRAEVEARCLAVAQELPAYTVLPAEESLSSCRALAEALLADQPEALAEGARQWAEREMRERGATPSELLAIADGLSQAVRDLPPAQEDLGQLNGRVDALGAALARCFADEVERLSAGQSHWEALCEITRELNTSLDVGRTLHRTLAALMTAIGAETGVVLLADGESGQLVPESAINWQGGDFSRAMLPSAWREGEADSPLVLNDLLAADAEPWVEMLAGPNVRSLMVAPLVANGAVKGLLAAASARVGALDPHHVRLFRGVVGQVATAIGNAEVYRLLSGQAQELGQMLRHQQEEATGRQAILTSIADGVVVHDAEGQTILVNPAAERILDTPAAQLAGQDFRALFSAFDSRGRGEAIAAMGALLGVHSPEVHQAFGITLEIDSRIVRAHLSPVLTEQGDFLGVVTVVRDVTQAVEENRARSEFVSNVSHELRTPMTAIKGYTDLLHAGSVGSINDGQARFLGIIKNNADRLTALINDLLDITRVDTGRVRFEPRPMQIGDVIADVVNVLANQAEAKDQTLTYEVVGGLPDILGDRDRLNQVLTNLVGNGIRYTPKGGEIEVRAYPVDGAVRVDVRDTGIGIAPDDLGRIFERFYRADHPLVWESGGSGLGLAIVKMFVEMHGGRVWVESEQGKGSTFTFVLPMTAPAEERQRRIPARLIARVRTIMVLDDEQAVANFVKMQLEEGGSRVSVLRGGRSFVARAEEKRPDLIILDLTLPDADGLDVLRALKRSAVTAGIPVIVLTRMPDDGTAWKWGIVEYLSKPVAGEDLLRSVEEALTWQGRALIVDDEADTVGLLSAAIRQIGFTPLVATDGYEALAMTRRHRPDLILLDLRMPGMDGYEALSHLKRDAVTQAIPIVVISAHVADTEQERKRLIAMGAASFLPKPFSIGDLLDQIEAALRPVSGHASS